MSRIGGKVALRVSLSWQIAEERGFSRMEMLAVLRELKRIQLELAMRDER